MSLIFKVAAGVVIGLLLVQIVNLRMVEDDYVEISEDLMYVQGFSNNYNRLTSAIKTYYRKNKKLPEFVSDLKCIEYINGSRDKIDCAHIYSDGIFYMQYQNDWASVEPYVVDGDLYSKCKTSKSFTSKFEPKSNMPKGYYEPECDKLDVSLIPQRQASVYDCNKTSDYVEKKICSSDKLIAIDNKLISMYDSLLSKNVDDKYQQVVNDKQEFIQRRKKCDSKECIDEITRKKINRIELLGVWGT